MSACVCKQKNYQGNLTETNSELQRTVKRIANLSRMAGHVYLKIQSSQSISYILLTAVLCYFTPSRDKYL